MPGENIRQMQDEKISVSVDVFTFVHPKRVTHTRNIEKIPFKLNEQEMLAFFKKHDVNKDGRLSWDELKQAFKDLGVSWVTWTTDRALVKADDDEDGYISEREMAKLIDFALERKLRIK